MAIHIPENVIGPRDAPWLIVDAKYKNPMRESWGKQYFHNDDLYQALTYAAALDAPAVLVYPGGIETWASQSIAMRFAPGSWRLIS